jgi:CHASE2 domain-containing sensor protein
MAPYFFGVEIHALTFSNLLHKDWLVRLPTVWRMRLLEALILAGVGGAIGYGLCLLRPWWATGVALLTALAVATVACFSALGLRVWFPWLIIVVAQIPVALGWSYLFNSLQVRTSNPGCWNGHWNLSCLPNKSNECSTNPSCSNRARNKKL